MKWLKALSTLLLATSLLAQTPTPIIGTSSVLTVRETIAKGWVRAYSATAVQSVALASYCWYIDSGTTAHNLAFGLYNGVAAPIVLIAQAKVAVPAALPAWVCAPMAFSSLTSTWVYWEAVMGLDGAVNLRSQHAKGQAVMGWKAAGTLPSAWSGRQPGTSGPPSAYGLTTATPLAATPTFSPAPGAFTSAQQVTIADSTTGAVIYFTTDGTVPTTASVQFAAPIPVSTTTTLNAMATAANFSQSAIATGLYTINPITPPPPTHQVTLKWALPATEPVGTIATGVQVLRQTGTTGGFAALASLPSTATAYTDTNVMAGQIYEYEVETVAAASNPTNSVPSNVAAVNIPTP